MEDEQQLLPAVAVGDVAVPQRTGDDPRYRLQRMISGEVTKLVVVALEAINVAEGERESKVRLATRRAVELANVLGERTAVTQTGEGITARVLQQALVERRELRLTFRRRRTSVSRRCASWRPPAGSSTTRG